MDKLKLVDKLREKAHISYEEAKDALENNNWDILEAMVYLEAIGILKKPQVSEFYTNDNKSDYKSDYKKEAEDALVKVNDFKGSSNSKEKNDFNGIFEAVCKVIDTGNNIFLEVSRKGVIIIKLPFTVMAVLLFFAFWFIIPLMLIGLFFEIEFSIAAKRLDSNIINKANKVFKELSVGAQDIKEKVMAHINIEK